MNPYSLGTAHSAAAGALISNTDDLTAFLDGLTSGLLMSDSAFEQMTDMGIEGYGLGIARGVLGQGATGLAHNGAIPGYISTMAIDPATGDLIIVLTNNDAINADRLARRILAIW